MVVDICDIYIFNNTSVLGASIVARARECIIVYSEMTEAADVCWYHMWCAVMYYCDIDSLYGSN